MSSFQSLREMRPYHLLLLAVLAAVVLAQVAAMVMVTRSQVQKAQAYYAKAPVSAPESPSARAGGGAANLAAQAPQPAGDGVVRIGFVLSR